jgi:pimeloyl-ACP methyl ester carboxylesterase
VNGMSLPYVEQGRGALLVLVHGAESDLRTWERQRAALAAHYRTIAFTQRSTVPRRGPRTGLNTASVHTPTTWQRSFVGSVLGQRIWWRGHRAATSC